MDSLGSIPGNVRALAPVARMMCLAVSSATPLPSLVTDSFPFPARLPCPSNTVTLFLRRRCWTPRES